MLWHELSWPLVESASKELAVVIPLGSCEQHGRHLPLFVDSIQVTAIAEKVEQRLHDRIYLTPTLWLGSSHHHLDFPGTISVRPSLYSEMIKDVARSVIAAGFTRIFFLNGHGGNEVPGAAALSDLIATDDRAESCYLGFGSWWQVGRDAMEPKRHGMTTPTITHACEYETSMMLVLRPDLVKLENAAKIQPPLSSPWRAKVGVHRRFHRLTPSGNSGDPTAATVEKGKSLFDAVVEDVTNFLTDFATWPALPVLKPNAAGPGSPR